MSGGGGGGRGRRSPSSTTPPAPALASQPREGTRKASVAGESPQEKPSESPVLTAASQISWCPSQPPEPPRRDSPGHGEHQWEGYPHPARLCYLQAIGNNNINNGKM